MDRVNFLAIGLGCEQGLKNHFLAGKLQHNRCDCLIVGRGILD